MMGYQFRGGCSRDTRGGLSRDQGESNSDYGLVQQETFEDMEIHLPFNRDECKGGRAVSFGSSVEGSEKCMVEFYGGLADDGGGEMLGLGVVASDITNSHIVRSGSNGMPI